MNAKEKRLLKAAAELTEQQEKRIKEWYSIRPIIGNANWAIFFILLLAGVKQGNLIQLQNIL